MRARAAGGDLELEAPGTAGGELRFPAIWLRDNCPCPECRDPRTGQKLFGIGDLPDGLTVATVEEGGIEEAKRLWADLDALASSLAVLERQEVAA